MSVYLLLCYLCEFHDVLLIFITCCVLLQSFMIMSDVFRISSSVEVFVQVYRELNTAADEIHLED